MVTTTETKISYLGDGVTTVFPFTFAFHDGDDIKVTLSDVATGTETEITKDFYLDETAKTITYPGYAPGAEIAEKDRPAVLTSAEKITIHRETPITQESDLGDKYPLPTIEAMPDKLTFIAQEMKESIARSIKVSISSDETPEEVLDSMFNARDESVASAAAASASEKNAAASETAASTSETNAAASEASAAAILADIEAAAKLVGGIATVYDASTTYQPGAQVMLSDGTTWRCIEQSTGEYPPTSGKWVATAVATEDTFERDSENDLMPCEYAKATRLWSIDAEEDIYPAEIVA